MFGTAKRNLENENRDLDVRLNAAKILEQELRKEHEHLKNEFNKLSQDHLVLTRKHMNLIDEHNKAKDIAYEQQELINRILRELRGYIEGSVRFKLSKLWFSIWRKKG